MIPPDSMPTSIRLTIVGIAALLAPLPAQSLLGNANPRELAWGPNGSAVFVANPAEGEGKLYRTDGTLGTATVIGSFVVADHVPSPGHLTLAGPNTLFFTADDGTGVGTELWVSDLTAAGTRLVGDLRPGWRSSYPQDLTALPAGPLVFSAIDDVRGREPWVATGATAIPLADVQLGNTGSNPCDFVRVGAQVFFTADDGLTGRELWATDGTSGGTRLVRDIRPGAAGSSPSSLFAARGMLWFCAHDGVAGFELWRSDGTTTGTRRIADLNPGPGSSQPGDFVEAFGRVWFVAHNGNTDPQIYSTDGTPSGTVPLVAGPTAPRSPSSLTHAAGRVWFVADDGVHGAEPWSTDGTANGTAIVRDIHLGQATSTPGQFVELDANNVVFVANDGLAGRELWRADANGASIVRDLWPGSTSARITGMRSNNGMVLFAAQAPDGAGSELFRTDGTAAGTVRLENLNTATEQLTLELFHTVNAQGVQEVDFVVPAEDVALLLLATRPGPGINLNALGTPSYGLFGLDPATFIGPLIMFGLPSSGTPAVGPTVPAQATMQVFFSAEAIGLAIQAASLDPIVFSGVTSLQSGYWDLSQCAQCAGVPLQARRAFYVDDTYEYDLEFALPQSDQDIWLRVLRVSADGNEEQVEFRALRPGRTRLRQQVELRRQERLELRVYCGDPDSSCWVAQVLSC